MRRTERDAGERSDGIGVKIASERRGGRREEEAREREGIPSENEVGRGLM